MRKINLLLAIILFIMGIVPGVIYILFHPYHSNITLILLLIFFVIPGVVYLLWPSEGYLR
ncbi:hypothetical protein SCHIN_v1c07510 [Spiroplasma chinense]|uniref:Uncharacterized protein n=1 Tax=Spiroplasma chinense TaxID=216932 RepID=A0A5B9Y5F5_9MOLU|nr:hypothetical protein [Spiroplasma chinense]QEH61946.1 hypothetical protein SCHIN_v1c07510 [Spiroplasma chinense]